MLFVVVALSLLGRGTAHAKLKVVGTVPDLAAIAQAVGGNRVDVSSLTLPTQDPHFVDPRPHLVLQLNRADLLALVGLDLEVGWLPTLLTGARNAKVQSGADGYLDCSTAVPLKQVPKVKLDRSMGDIHPGGNPHFLVHPGNAIAVAHAMARRMARIDPEGASSYQANARRFASAVAVARKRWRALLSPFAGTEVVAFHMSWIYFTSAFDLRIAAYLEPKPGIPPNAAHLLRLIRLMQAKKIPLVLMHSYYPDRAARLVASKTGATLVRVAGGTDLRAGKNYLDHMDVLVQQVAKALKAGHPASK